MGKGQRLIFASTGSTYGKVEGVATEETPIAPLTLYGKSKRDAEMLIRDSGRDHVILRFATVFGSSPRMRIDLLINDFVYQALHNRQIVLFEGYFRRTFLHSSDAAAVYPFAMANFDEMRGKVYNVGDESMNYTKRDDRPEDQRIRRLLSCTRPRSAPIPTSVTTRSTTAGYKSLGFSAKVGLDEGIRELVKILRVLTIYQPASERLNLRRRIMMPERVLLTGGSGFFGRRIAEALRRHGYDVVTPGRPEFDLLDAASTLRTLERLRPETIVHSAAYYGGLGICMAEPTQIFHRNILMGVNLFEAAARTGVRKIMAIGSACSYPGSVAGDMKEDDFWSGPLHPSVESYGFTKKVLEVGLRAYGRG